MKEYTYAHMSVKWTQLPLEMTTQTGRILIHTNKNKKKKKGRSDLLLSITSWQEADIKMLFSVWYF